MERSHLSVLLFDYFLIAQKHGISVTASNREVVEKSQIVWLAVKPHTISKVLNEISPVIRPDHHLVISAAAGIPIKTLEKVSLPWNRGASSISNNITHLVVYYLGLCCAWMVSFALSWEGNVLINPCHRTQNISCPL